MNAILDSFAGFWEILTGVFDDNRAKIIRLVCFSLLAFGIMWAAMNYFRADKIADTDVEFYSPAYESREPDRAALKRMADLAQAVQQMRQGGEAIAETITAAHTRPFNIEGYNEMGLESLSTGGVVAGGKLSLAEVSGDVRVQEAENDIPNILVKAVMTSGKTRAAIIDIGEWKGFLARKGEYLPENSGRVVDVQRKKITVRYKGKNIDYEVPEIPLTLKSNAKPNSNNKRIGMEKFLFEGTVPADSPLSR
ncbi:MAG: hypothetical protein IJP53_04950 [Synergistaceae bacterium]|nr:hypothetical protein [Synergistaceae bacterium]